MSKRYNLKLTEQQLKLLRVALESYMRLGIGQLENVIGDLIFNHFNAFKDKSTIFHNDEEFKSALFIIKRKFFDCNSLNSSKGICSPDVDLSFKLAYEMNQKIRQHLAYERTPEGGYTRDFDEPLKLTEEPVIEIEVQNEKAI